MVNKKEERNKLIDSIRQQVKYRKSKKKTIIDNLPANAHKTIDESKESLTEVLNKIYVFLTTQEKEKKKGEYTVEEDLESEFAESPIESKMFSEALKLKTAQDIQQSGEMVTMQEFDKLLQDEQTGSYDISKNKFNIQGDVSTIVLGNQEINNATNTIINLYKSIEQTIEEKKEKAAGQPIKLEHLNELSIDVQLNQNNSIYLLQEEIEKSEKLHNIGIKEDKMSIINSITDEAVYDASEVSIDLRNDVDSVNIEPTREEVREERINKAREKLEQTQLEKAQEESIEEYRIKEELLEQEAINKTIQFENDLEESYVPQTQQDAAAEPGQQPEKLEPGEQPEKLEPGEQQGIPNNEEEEKQADINVERIIDPDKTIKNIEEPEPIKQIQYNDQLLPSDKNFIYPSSLTFEYLVKKKEYLILDMLNINYDKKENKQELLELYKNNQKKIKQGEEEGKGKYEEDEDDETKPKNKHKSSDDHHKYKTSLNNPNFSTNTDQLDHAMYVHIMPMYNNYMYVYSGTYAWKQPEFEEELLGYRSEILQGVHIMHILNTNPIQLKDNGHWIALIVTLYDINFIDSEARPEDNTKYHDYATHLINKLDLPNKVTIKVNKNWIESVRKEKGACGVYALLSLERWMESHGNFKYASFFNETSISVNDELENTWRTI